MTKAYGTSMIVTRRDGRIDILDFEMADSAEDARNILRRSPQQSLENFSVVFATIVIEDPRAED